jgi:putative membrane protein (TIGR04086 family)
MRSKRTHSSIRYRQTAGAAIAVISGIAVLAASVFIFGWLLSKFDAGGLILSLLSAGFICFCAYTAGLAGAVYERKSSALIGLVAGLIMFVVLTVSGTLLTRAAISFSLTTRLILSLIAGVIGGLSGTADKK